MWPIWIRQLMGLQTVRDLACRLRFRALLLKMDRANAECLVFAQTATDEGLNNTPSLYRQIADFDMASLFTGNNAATPNTRATLIG